MTISLGCMKAYSESKGTTDCCSYNGWEAGVTGHLTDRAVSRWADVPFGAIHLSFLFCFLSEWAMKLIHLQPILYIFCFVLLNWHNAGVFVPVQCIYQKKQHRILEFIFLTGWPMKHVDQQPIGSFRKWHWAGPITSLNNSLFGLCVSVQCQESKRDEGVNKACGKQKCFQNTKNWAKNKWWAN